MSGKAAEHNLSGRWTGFYNMPIAMPPTRFDATMRDNGGLLSGITTELGDTPDCAGMRLEAVIEGHRDGNCVRFSKQYDYLGRAHDVVHYEGTIEPGGNEIGGTWTILGAWSGTFLMIRGSAQKEAITRKVGEKV